MAAAPSELPLLLAGDMNMREKETPAAGEVGLMDAWVEAGSPPGQVRVSGGETARARCVPYVCGRCTKPSRNGSPERCWCWCCSRLERLCVCARLVSAGLRVLLCCLTATAVRCCAGSLRSLPIRLSLPPRPPRLQRWTWDTRTNKYYDGGHEYTAR